MELEGKDLSIAGILTNPDSKRGRHAVNVPTDVSAAALDLDVKRAERGLKPIVQLKPEKPDVAFMAEAASLNADLLVSFAYGTIFRPEFLSLFPMGGINIHPSLLPKYRGASPIPAVILAREKETGICIQRLAPEMDTGDILATDRFELSGRETALSLSETVSFRAARLLAELISKIASGAACGSPQEGKSVYCREIKKEAGRIDWNKSALYIDAQVRAFTPWPLSFTGRAGDTLFILEAESLTNKPDAASPPPGTVLGTDKTKGVLIQTGDGVLAVRKLQWQAKKPLDWKDFCNGTRDFTGSRLG